MFARMLSLAFVSLIPGISLAQLPSQHFSSINYLGRYLGFGYSDGYHACQDGRCTPVGQPKSWDAMSTFYGSPTLPPNNRVVGRQLTTMPSPAFNHEHCVEPVFSPGSQSQLAYPMQTTLQTEVAPSMVQPNSQPQPHPQTLAPHWSPSPLSFEPYTPNLKPLQSSPSDRGSYESVPPAPRTSQPSTTDREQLELPSPLQRSESKSPEAQYRRVPPGSYSLIQPTSVRAR
jgi:hypothetical protein